MSIPLISKLIAEFRSLNSRAAGVLEYRDWADRAYTAIDFPENVYRHRAWGPYDFLRGFVGNTDDDGLAQARLSAARINYFLESYLQDLTGGPDSNTSISQAAAGTKDADTRGDASPDHVVQMPNAKRGSAMKIFISHSSQDTHLASSLIDLLRKALVGLEAKFIRCSSVPGYKLPGGANVNDLLKDEVHGAPIFIGLLTRHSLASTYVLFELGARWGAGLNLIPLRAGGLELNDLKAPLTALHMHNCSDENDLHQMISKIAEELDLRRESPDVYSRDLKRLLDLSSSV